MCGIRLFFGIICAIFIIVLRRGKAIIFAGGIDTKKVMDPLGQEDRPAPVETL